MRRTLLLIVSMVSPIAASEITICTLPPERWQEFCDLRVQAFQEVPYAIVGTDIELEHPEKFYRERLAESLKEDGLWYIFAEIEGKIVGMAGAMCLKKQVPAMRHAATILSVYVKPEFRGQKIGQMLLEDLLARLARSSFVTHANLLVTCGQKAAIKLYEQCGFSMCGKMRDNLLIDGVYYDQLMMERRIK